MEYESYISPQTKFVFEAAWLSRSIVCQNLTGKNAVVFSNATHVVSMTKILTKEMGICVSCVGFFLKCF